MTLETMGADSIASWLSFLFVMHPRSPSRWRYTNDTVTVTVTVDVFQLAWPPGHLPYSFEAKNICLHVE